MTWTAAALSFLLRKIDKPVVLTGSEYPIDHPLTDAFYNANQALRLEKKGVHISFRGETFSATRSRKNALASNLFQEFPRNSIPTARGSGHYESLGREPVWICPAPGLSLPEITGPVLLEMYPSWTAPESWVEQLLTIPYPLFLVASHGLLPSADYPSLRALEKKALLLPMLPESAWSKLHSFNKECDLVSWMREERSQEFISR